VAAGQPALDAGCGTGRLLLPWLAAGYDVDGCDVSSDMVEHCRRRAPGATLFVQALHDLDPPRRYRTIVACGVFGLGSSRAEDAEALGRLHDALEPGGLLLLDHEVPWANPRRWQQWTRSERAQLPEPWPEDDGRRTAPDGSEYALVTRALSVDPLDASMVLEIRARKWRDGDLVATEERQISIRSYFKDELVHLLGRAGFDDVEVRGAYTDAEPTADDDFLVFAARRR
jgi:SAM-dependent methyltransferase